MIVPASTRIATLGPRLRGVLLILVALFVSHDAVYLARFGPGDGYVRAMAASGHDAWWLPASLLIVSTGILGFLVALRAIAVLDRSARPSTAEATASRVDMGASYAREFLMTWRVVLPVVVALFLVQENAEALAVHGHLVGLDPVFGADAWVVPPLLVAVTGILAAIGALLRWRVRVLVARIAAARRLAFPRRRNTAAPATWRTIAASVAHRSILLRRDPGRAPPLRRSTAVSAA